jgi:hypothetical protein
MELQYIYMTQYCTPLFSVVYYKLNELIIGQGYTIVVVCAFFNH